MTQRLTVTDMTQRLTVTDVTQRLTDTERDSPTDRHRQRRLTADRLPHPFRATGGADWRQHLRVHPPRRPR